MALIQEYLSDSDYTHYTEIEKHCVKVGDELEYFLHTHPELKSITLKRDSMLFSRKNRRCLIFLYLAGARLKSGCIRVYMFTPRVHSCIHVCTPGAIMYWLLRQ